MTNDWVPGRGISLLGSRFTGSLIGLINRAGCERGWIIRLNDLWGDSLQTHQGTSLILCWHRDGRSYWQIGDPLAALQADRVTHLVAGWRIQRQDPGWTDWLAGELALRKPPNLIQNWPRGPLRPDSHLGRPTHLRLPNCPRSQWLTEMPDSHGSPVWPVPAQVLHSTTDRRANSQSAAPWGLVRPHDDLCIYKKKAVHSRSWLRASWACDVSVYPAANQRLQGPASQPISGWVA